MNISIVILAYNKARMTEKCIDYIERNVTGITYEIILIDNASTDIISEKYKSKVKYVRNEENLMFAKGCNQGAKLAKYDNLCFLNNDVYVWRGFKEASEFLLSDESYGMVGVKLLYENGAIQHAGVEIVGDRIDQNITNHRYRGLRGNHPQANIIREYQNVTGACMFIRKADFEAVGGFEEAYINNFEDNDLCFKIKYQLNKKIMYFPNVLMHHLEAQSPRDNSNFKFQQNHKLFFEKWKDKLVIDKDKWDREDEGNFIQTDEIKIMAIYKTCEKELKKENFKPERPEWFNKKNCFTSFYNSAKKSPIKINIYVVFDGDANGDFATFLKSHDINFVPVDIKSMYKANQYCYQMAAASEYDFIYFVEDDYLHTEDGLAVNHVCSIQTVDGNLIPDYCKWNKLLRTFSEYHYINLCTFRTH